MISVSYDEETGIVFTLANGLASVDAFNAYAPRCVELLERSRIRHGRSLHLVDAQDNPIQQKDTFDHMADVSKAVLREDDRCAVVLNSMLARMQIGRMPDSFARQFFTDCDAARTWLLSQAGKPAAQATA